MCYRRPVGPHHPKYLVGPQFPDPRPLWQQVKHFPKSSQIITTAVNIPDIVTVMRHHGLVPVPIPLDPRNLKPDLGAMRGQVNERTKAILVAHIYRRRFDMDGTFAIAKQHNL